MKLIHDALKEKKASPKTLQRDFLDQMIDDMKKEKFLSDDFAVFVMFGVLFASFETISTTLTLAIKLLIEHPLVMQQLIVSDNYLTIFQSFCYHVFIDNPSGLKPFI